MTPRQRLTPETRKASIIAAAILCASEHGLARVTRELVAAEAQCSPSLVSYYWLDMGALLDDVMEVAVGSRLLPIVAQGLAQGHPVALGAPAGVREAAARTLAAARGQ